MIAAASVVSVGASPALAASGGGCRNTSENDWTIRSCVSANGGYAWPDFYVNQLGEGYETAECELQLIDQWGDPVSTTWRYCEQLGHYGPDRVATRPGVRYNALVTVEVNLRRQTMVVAWSPQLIA